MKKSPTTAALLCLLFCCLPVGHFYLGQMQKGVIWLGISFFSLGLGGFFAALDAWLTARKMAGGETVGELEFFPQARGGQIPPV
jgi:TM2 domain-containing membrane protein YozV